MVDTPFVVPVEALPIHQNDSSFSWVRQARPHRIALAAVGLAVAGAAGAYLRWNWLPDYGPLILQGLWRSIWLLCVTVLLGFALAIPIGLAQASGPPILAVPARVFCTIIRGTPLLLQLWLIYYGIGSLLAHYPLLRRSEMWPYLRQAWPYAVLCLTLSYAGYEGEVMRGAFSGVAKGQLEAGRAFGMPRFTILRRIWLPLAVHRALPTLAGEAVLQLKATPLVATITMVDLYSVASQVRHDTFLTYEPLLLLAVGYIIIAFAIVELFRRLERMLPSKLG